jgi:hypothetical protein
MIDFPATSSKFTIRRDDVSKLYYTLSTNVTEANLAVDAVWARNNLVLAVSKDLLHWTICKRLLYDHTGFTTADSAKYTGFHCKPNRHANQRRCVMHHVPVLK